MISDCRAAAGKLSKCWKALQSFLKVPFPRTKHFILCHYLSGEKMLVAFRLLYQSPTVYRLYRILYIKSCEDVVWLRFHYFNLLFFLSILSHAGCWITGSHFLTNLHLPLRSMVQLLYNLPEVLFPLLQRICLDYISSHSDNITHTIYRVQSVRVFW